MLANLELTKKVAQIKLRAEQAEINEKTTIELLTAMTKKVEQAEVHEKNNVDMMTAKGKLRKEFDEKSLEFLQA